MSAISGIRPTGKLHLGNYIGSILPAIKYNADVLVAQYHAPESTYADHKALHDELKQFFDYDKIRMQAVRFNPKLYFDLMAVTPSGLLKHMPQYKEKEKTALMFTYPVLMAHDIADYDQVIVGDDQKPHIELAKDILHKVGRKCPTPIYEGGRVMDLRNPANKMSKSKPNSCLFLSDSKEVRDKKVMKAVTDKQGVENIMFIINALNPDLNVTMYGTYVDMKQALIAELDKHFGKN